MRNKERNTINQVNQREREKIDRKKESIAVTVKAMANAKGGKVAEDAKFTGARIEQHTHTQ
jgi:hypothetical protein